jgi:hypothetical protein
MVSDSVLNVEKRGSSTFLQNVFQTRLYHHIPEDRMLAMFPVIQCEVSSSSYFLDYKVSLQNLSFFWLQIIISTCTGRFVG